MPWKKISAMDQKIQMIGDYLSNNYTISDLSEIYGVSRNTIYKWIERYKQGGNEGLTNRRSSPLRRPNTTSLEIAREIVAFKLQHKNWGPKKLIYWLKQHHSETSWPANSTASNILKQAGLVKPRKRRSRTPSNTEPFQECLGPNLVWSTDYKGQFKTTDGQMCYPLTISDIYSRYLLACKNLRHPSFVESKSVFEALFKQYGLPAAIRTDNGTPFAATGLGGLSRLSIWFIKLGIKPERIKAGHPEENGRHERMHRSLKEATANPPKRNHREQQKAFDAFRSEYNNERPHEALSMQTPSKFYKPSLRPYPTRMPEITYHGNCMIRKVRHNGEIKWKGEKVYVSGTLAKEKVGLKQIAEHQWQLYFSTYILGILDELDMKIQPCTLLRERKC